LSDPVVGRHDIFVDSSVHVGIVNAQYPACIGFLSVASHRETPLGTLLRLPEKLDGTDTPSVALPHQVSRVLLAPIERYEAAMVCRGVGDQSGRRFKPDKVFGHHIPASNA